MHFLIQSLCVCVSSWNSRLCKWATSSLTQNGSCSVISDLFQWVRWPRRPLIPAAAQIGIHAVRVFVSHRPRGEGEQDERGRGRRREQQASDTGRWGLVCVCVFVCVWVSHKAWLVGVMILKVLFLEPPLILSYILRCRPLTVCVCVCVCNMDNKVKSIRKY